MRPGTVLVLPQKGKTMNKVIIKWNDGSETITSSLCLEKYLVFHGTPPFKFIVTDELFNELELLDTQEIRFQLALMMINGYNEFKEEIKKYQNELIRRGQRIIKHAWRVNHEEPIYELE